MTNLPVLPGAEPLYSVGNRTGVLVSHGFTGTPQSMRFLAEGIARAGYTVAMPPEGARHHAGRHGPGDRL